MKHCLGKIGVATVLAAFPANVRAQTPYPVDRETVARIREEGLHRSQLPDTLSYLTDVLGGRLTNSAAMDRARRWALEEMAEIGLENTVREPFMNAPAAIGASGSGKTSMSGRSSRPGWTLSKTSG